MAEDQGRLNTTCVIKQFAPSLGNSAGNEVLEYARKLFYKEAEQLLKLGEEHLQIPTLFDYFEADKYLYLVQQYIEGKTFLQELEEEGNFHEQKIRYLLNDILPILQFVHEKNVIHRDIKPENIIRRQSDSKLILIDFGVAKQHTGTMLSRQGTVVGTPGYAPTEQLRGVTLPCSDLYSLGVTCIRLMTGIFMNAIDNSDLLYDVLNGNWLWREKLPQGITVSQQLGEVLDKLLEDAPKNRYQSAKDVLKALQEPPLIKGGQVGGQPFLNQGGQAASQPPLINVGSQQKNPPCPPLIRGGRGGVKTFSFDVITVNAQGKEINRQRKQAEYLTEDLGTGIILDIVSIPGGTFNMGSPTSEAGRHEGESPQHWVTVQPFYLGKYAVTQAQWKVVANLAKVKQDLDPYPSDFKGANRPVEQVNWEDAIEFCARLSRKTGKKYRLPSEAEWEYACRAGITTPFHFGETITPDLVNYNGDYPYASAPKGKFRDQTTDVGSFPPNAFGLYDMHGNVWEWCQDVYLANYRGAPTDGSVSEKGGDSKYRMQRGGCWFNLAGYCRCANRGRSPQLEVRRRLDGFRVAVSPGLSP